MNLGKWLRHKWLQAQGVPEWDILHRTWKSPGMCFETPRRCIVCKQPWRPDYPEYIGVFGTLYQEKSLGFWRWCSSPLGVYDIPAEDAQDHIRYLCPEHLDRWESVVDCFTGIAVEMTRAPTKWERRWRDARYWTGSACRFVWLAGQWVWWWTAYKVAGHKAEYVKGPWPPLRVRQKGESR